MKLWNKCLTVLLAAVLLLQTLPCALGVEAEPATITIRTEADLQALARSCALDSWSQGKTVVLAADIQLSSTDFSPIPTFGGVFDGGGHTISGLRLTGSGNVQGLFRYIQPSGVVKDLTVAGSVAPTDFRDTVGGIAGDNRGQLLRCTFVGSVEGKNNIGGLVGTNQAGGQLINCTFSGFVDGELHVGGIVGQNLGSVIQCTNQGSVGTTQAEVSADPQELLQDSSLTDAAADLSGRTDIGGIAGCSSGIVQSCRNEGAVGYSRVGYNIGGIVGRQSGCLDSCVNTGTVLGRKDVGGIAGQLEPAVTLLYQESFLEQLGDELDVLLGRMNGLLSDAGTVSDDIHGQIEQLTQRTRDTKDAVSDLAGAVSDWTDQGVDEINDLSARVSRTLNQLSPLVEDAGGHLAELEDVMDQLADVLDEAARLGGLGSDSASELNEAMDEAAAAIRQLDNARVHVQAALSALQNGLGDEAAMARALQALANSVDQLGSGFQALNGAFDRLSAALEALLVSQGDPQAVQELLGALSDMGNAAQQGGEALGQMGTALKKLAQAVLDGNPTQALKTALSELHTAASLTGLAFGHLEEGAKCLADAAQSLEAAGDVLQKTLQGFGEVSRSLADVLGALSDDTQRLYEIIQQLADEPTITIPSLSAAVSEQRSNLNTAVSNLLNEAEALEQRIATSTDTLLADLEGTNDQLGVIVELVQTQSTQARQTKPEDRIEDISDQVDGASQSTGRISDCRNEGTVEGDLNGAGIVGTIAIDLEFDPEDDLNHSGDRSLDFLVQAKAVVFTCTNFGPVTVKKDGAGGIAGRMDLGMIQACQNYADVTSTGGNYVGGIAGTSQGLLQGCWSKCTLSGNHYVGGIAGQGSSLTDCRAVVEIDQGKAYVGAVAGTVAEDGTVQGNLFASDTLAAIDGISYAGKAEPAVFDQLCALPDTPADFAQLTLRFVADGKTVATRFVPYGESLSDLPEIPAKEGCSAAWPELDYSRITASQTIEAVYTPYDSTLSDGQTPPQILVDGSFSSEAALVSSSSIEDWVDDQGKTHSAAVWTVTITDPAAEQLSYTIHYRLPDPSGRWQLWVLGEDGWQQQDWTKDKSYLLLSGTGETTTFCVLSAPFPGWAVALLILLPLLLLALLLIVRRRRKKRRAAAAA